MKHTLLLTLLCIGIGAYSQPPTELFPDFQEVDLDGNIHTLSDYLDDGKIVLIDVFTTWCPHCVNSLPSVDSLEAVHGENLIILSFEKDSGTSNEAEWGMNNNITHPIFSNSTSTIGTWNTIGQPNFFLICPDGTFETHLGSIQQTPEILIGYADNCEIPEEEKEEEEDEIGENPSSTFEESNGADFVTSTEELEARFQVLKNPIDEILKFESSFSGELSLLDLSGKEVLQTSFQSGLTSLNLNSLQRGIYFLGISNGGFSISQKIMLN